MTRDDIVQELATLPPQKLGLVRSFIDFLKWLEAEEDRRSISFDEWALNLAREQGFSHLTEDDVAQLVHEMRRERA